MQPRLGVNIDHVATLRQQRGEEYPSISRAAEAVLKAGADQITIHLREDRRHIQDADVAPVHDWCKKFNRPLNLEMGCHPDIVEIACRQQPEWVCLVPEKREERTTEGGLALEDGATYTRILKAIDQLAHKTPATKVSLFIEASPGAIAQSLKLPVHAVEIHTGDYAKDFLQNKPLQKYLDLYARAHGEIKSAGRGFHAGHGLTDLSLAPLLKQGLFEEYNIGHWIVGEALYTGLEHVVVQLRAQMQMR